MNTESLSEYVARKLPHLTKRPMTDLQRRRLLCDDLEYCVVHDKELLTIVIDEFVYRLNDNEVKDFEAEVNKILGEDE